jgi:excisionase family DNA binding protein
MEQLLTVKQVAELLQVKAPWVHAHSNGSREPTIPSAKLGKLRRFRRVDIERFIHERVDDQPRVA